MRQHRIFSAATALCWLLALVHTARAAGSPDGAQVETGAQSVAMGWLDDTEWLWNEWSTVALERGGRFTSPNCDDAERCRWWTSGETVLIRWADAGTHTLSATAQVPAASTSLKGKRDLDGDPCAATFVRKGVRLLGHRLPDAVERLASQFYHGELDLQLAILMSALGLLLLLALGAGCCAASQPERDAAVLRGLLRSRGRLDACAAELHPEELEKLAARLRLKKAERARDDGFYWTAAPGDGSASTAAAGAPVDYGWLACAASWLLPGAVFYLSTAPDVCLVDAGALTLAAAGPGVAHPPGFPLWTMLGWLSSLCPGRVIRNVNLLSAVSATLLCHLIWRLSRRWMLRSGTQEGVPPALMELGPLCGAMLAGLSFPVWGFATFAEVYHVTSSGLVAAILVTCQWRDREGAADDRTIALGGLLFGLGACAHHITAALALPALIYLAATRPTNGTDGDGTETASRAAYYCGALRNVCIAAGAAIVPGVVCYGWLYFVGSGHPLWNWGGVDDLEKLWWHISGKQYQVNFGQFRAEGLWVEAGRLGWLVVTSWTPVGLVVAWQGLSTMAEGNAAGGLSLQAERTTLLILLVLGLIFAFCYEIAEDKEGYYVTVSWVVGLAFGVGATDILRRACRSKSSLLMLGTALLVLSAPIAVGVLNEGGCQVTTLHAISRCACDL